MGEAPKRLLKANSPVVGSVLDVDSSLQYRRRMPLSAYKAAHVLMYLVLPAYIQLLYAYVYEHKRPWSTCKFQIHMYIYEYI